MAPSYDWNVEEVRGMNRQRRTKILIQGSPLLAKELADAILEHYKVIDIVLPRYGMTMVKMRETAKNSLFYIGEVLMTEAKVEVEGQAGIGMLMGMEDERARQLAIIDAAYKAELPQTIEWETRLLEMEQVLHRDKTKEQAALFKTKVTFETMDI